MRNNLRRVLSFAAWCLCCFITALPVSHALAGSNSWTAIGPDGANVVALAVDPRTPSTAYAGTVGSGVLKTADGGANWSTSNAGLPIPVVSALAIDPSAPSTLFAGTDAGVFKSTDGGESWTYASVGIADGSRATVIAIDLGSPDTLYTVTDYGIFKTTDGAASWTSINTGLLGLTPRVIAINPGSPSVLYLGVDDNVNYTANGIFKSTDAGNSWVRIYTTPFVEDFQYSVAAIAIDPRSTGRLYVAFGGGGLLWSADGGASWSYPNPLQALQQAGLSSLAIDPVSSETIYAGTYSGVVFRSTDAGVHWTPVTDGPLDTTSISVVALAPSNPAAVYVGCGTGIFRRSGEGGTWTRLTLGVRDVAVHPLAIDPAAASTIYAGVGGRIVKTVDGGSQWTDSDVGLPGQRVNALAIDPASPSTVYAAVDALYAAVDPVYKSTDAAAQWATASWGLGPYSIRALAIAPAQPSTLYATRTAVGVAKSTDGGSLWTSVNNGLTAPGPYPFVGALAVDPTNADIVYVATLPTDYNDAEIFKSTNGAAQWRQVPIALPTNTLITSFAIDPATPSTMYAAYVDYASQSGGIYKSSDSGETWVPPKDVLPTGCCVTLTIDPSSPSRIYAATGGGIFRSTDAATSWTFFNSNLPTLDVSSVSIDRTGTLLRAATGAGLFEYQINAGGNHTGLWGSGIPEAGWGINVSHQGDTIVATWFTYDFNGRPAWLVVAATKTAAEVYSGMLYVADSGPAFDGAPFDSSKVVGTPFGKVTFTFADDDNATVAYGVAQTIPITRMRFSAPMPTCTWGAQSNPALATNFQGLWGAAPAGAESGWAINFTHQGDTIVAVWFTFGLDGEPLWLIVAATRTGPNVYAGRLFTATGPDFDSMSVVVTATEVGTATFTFADGNNAAFAYIVNGISQTKQITRKVFVAPGTVCQ